MNPNIAVVEAYLKALKEGDLSQAPLAENIQREGPLVDSPVRGRANVERLIKPLFPVIKDLRVRRHVADGEWVATLYVITFVFVKLQIFELFWVKDGLIQEARAFFDPREMLEKMGTRD